MIHCFFVCMVFANGSTWEISSDQLSKYLRGNISMVVCNDDDRVFILAREDHMVYRLNEAGKETLVFGNRGQGPGEMERPDRIHYFPEARLIGVTDRGRQKLILFDKDGTFEREIPHSHLGPDYEFLSLSMAAYNKNEMPDGTPNLGSRIYFRNTADQEDHLALSYSPDDHPDPQVFRSDDTTISGYLPWSTRVLVTKSPDGKWLFTGSNKDVDVSVFDSRTQKVVSKIVHEGRPRVLLEEAQIDDMDFETRLGSKVLTIRDFKHPQFKPLARSFYGAESGRLWIKLNTAWQAEQCTYMVYDRSGAYLGHLSLDESFTFVYADQEFLWGYHENEDEDYVISKRTYQLLK